MKDRHKRDETTYGRALRMLSGKGITINIKITVPFTVVASALALWFWLHK